MKNLIWSQQNLQHPHTIDVPKFTVRIPFETVVIKGRYFRGLFLLIMNTFPFWKSFFGLITVNSFPSVLYFISRHCNSSVVNLPTNDGFWGMKQPLFIRAIQFFNNKKTVNRRALWKHFLRCWLYFFITIVWNSIIFHCSFYYFLQTK